MINKQYFNFLINVAVNFNTLIINKFNNLTLNMFTNSKIVSTFALTVPVLLPVRSAHGSFFFIGFAFKMIANFFLSNLQIKSSYLFKTS